MTFTCSIPTFPAKPRVKLILELLLGRKIWMMSLNQTRHNQGQRRKAITLKADHLLGTELVLIRTLRSVAYLIYYKSKY